MRRRKNYYFLDRAKHHFHFNKMTGRDLLNLESELGRTIFGDMPKGVHREFFALSEKSWIWHEEWKDPNGKRHELTTRFEISKDKVVKVLPGPKYYEVKGNELKNFMAAVDAYHRIVLKNIYHK